MKINTGIITILKIKIENGTLIVSIFKCLRYIDQTQPRFFLCFFCVESVETLGGGGGFYMFSEPFTLKGYEKKSSERKKDKHPALIQEPSKSLCRIIASRRCIS